MVFRSASLLFASVLLSAAATVPRPAPELLIKLANGGETRLSSFKGKVVALEFILTTCQHCQNSSKHINTIYNELGARGFTAVGVAVNQMSHIYIQEFKQTLGLNYLIGYQHHEAAVEFLKHDPKLVMMFPQLVLIDRKGTIRYQLPGTDKYFENEEKNLREKVLLLLNEGSSVPAKK
jgi:peroxiredoxin